MGRTIGCRMALFGVLLLGACDLQQDLGRSRSQEPCPSGTTDCEGRCVELRSDPAHCGGCGLDCPTGKLCESGACVDRCSPQNSACGGACVTLYQDDRNCGRCGNTCTGAQHCDNAVCLSCAMGTVHCPVAGQPIWRCTNLATDSQNCGACGASCPQGSRCTGGSCS